MKEFGNRTLQRLERKVRYWFLKSLENRMIPSVRGCLSDPIDSEIRNCFREGIPTERVNYLLKRAWDKAYKTYEEHMKYN